MMKLIRLLIIAYVVAEGRMAGINFDLESWMKDLPSPLKDIPIIYLAIPGSHDSMTYGITRSSGLAPDAKPILHHLYPLFRGTILRWTITQSLDTTQQLQMGIRYLDLRLATKTGTEDLYFTHGLYADEITKPLEQVKEFVENHPGEVVILDFQHFYGFKPADHQRLVRFLLNLYGAKLCPPATYLPGITLNSLNRLHQQVIIVYRHEAAHSTNYFWRSQMMPSPWPRQNKTVGLLRFFGNLFRPPGIGFVHQAVLTPTPGFIIRKWVSNLRSQGAAPVLKEVLPKLEDFSPGSPNGPNRKSDDLAAPLNVVIADFIEMDNALFPKTIIQLNFKLLQNNMLVYHSDRGQ